MDPFRKSNKWGPKPPTVDNAKTDLTAKYLKVRQGSSVTVTATKARDQGTALDQSKVRPAAAPQAKGPRQTRAAQCGFHLLKADGSGAMQVSRSVEVLGGHLLDLAQTHRMEVALLWPGSLRQPAIAHAVATLSQWQDGNKRGIRTLLYPAKLNFLRGLNELQVHRKELGQLASTLWEPAGEAPNPLVTQTYPAKDPFLLSVNSIKGAGTENVHPTISELLPHFYSDQEFVSWRACDGDLLRHIRARLGDRAHSKSLYDLSLKPLGQPKVAPDALFALGWRTPPEDIPKALKALKAVGSPDVILIDATKAIRKNNSGWKAQMVRFLERVLETWPTATPGVCILTDEPWVKGQILQEVTKRVGKGSESLLPIQRDGLAMLGIPCASAREGVLPAAAVETLAPASRDIRVAFTDTGAAEVIGQFERLRNSLKDEDWQALLGAATTYLTALAALPSSTRVLTEWLTQADVPMAVRENYAWPTYRSKLAPLLRDPDFPERRRLERLLQRGDEMWRNYEEGTPFARQLATLIEEHTRGAEKCCVVFTRPTAKRLAERYFETFEGYPEGAGFEVLRDCVRFVVSASLDADLGVAPGARAKETLIFAGLDEESLRLLTLDPRISSPCYLLLTRRNASYLKVSLRSISAIPEFSSLTARVTPILAQLPDFPGIDERQLMSRGDFVLPTFSFEAGLSAAVSEQEDRDPNAWEFVLEGGLHVRRSPIAKAYIYDASLGYTSTRGFKAVTVEDLEEGQRLFVMSVELRELVETSFREAGVPFSHDKQFEKDLRAYHKLIVEATAAKFPAGNLLDKARLLHADILRRPDAPAELPRASTVRNWLDVDKLQVTVFEDATPQAPRAEAHFKAFASALGVSDIHAIYYWKSVIQPLRGVRRADGRRVSDVYAEMLLEPETVGVHQKLKPAVVAMLFARAKESVYAIEAVKRTEGALA